MLHSSTATPLVRYRRLSISVRLLLGCGSGKWRLVIILLFKFSMIFFAPKTGDLNDAKCSNSLDAYAILSEISESNLKPKVETAVRVLINAGISTPNIRRTAELTGVIQNVKEWSTFYIFWMLGVTFVILPISGLLGSPMERCEEAWLWWEQLLQACLWLMRFMSSRKKCFAVSALQVTVPGIVYHLVHIIYNYDDGFGCSPYFVHAFLSGPLFVAISFIGPARLASISLVGPVLVRCLLGAGAVPLTVGVAESQEGDLNSHETAEPRPDVVGVQTEQDPRYATPFESQNWIEVSV